MLIKIIAKKKQSKIRNPKSKIGIPIFRAAKAIRRIHP